MSLIQASLVTGFILMSTGLLLSFGGKPLHASILGFPRSKTCSVFFIGISTCWFLFRHVAHLSEADFGDYKLLIGAIALSVALLSFVFAPDFLAVRGLAMLVLLYSREVLDSAFLQEAQSRLVLVSVTYVSIVLAMYFGAWPYKMRDLAEWMLQNPMRVKGLGAVFAVFGFLVAALTFSF